jgi:hypothetical protein
MIALLQVITHSNVPYWQKSGSWSWSESSSSSWSWSRNRSSSWSCSNSRSLYRIWSIRRRSISGSRGGER